LMRVVPLFAIVNLSIYLASTARPRRAIASRDAHAQRKDAILHVYANGRV
jgi:hypothetical protein